MVLYTRVSGGHEEMNRSGSGEFLSAGHSGFAREKLEPKETPPLNRARCGRKGIRLLDRYIIPRDYY